MKKRAILSAVLSACVYAGVCGARADDVPGFLPETVVIAPGNGVATNVAATLSGLYNVQVNDGTTGGGIVFHTEDLTFSLVFPAQERPTEIYKKLHGFIFEALARVGVKGHILTDKLPATAYAPSVNHEASACFIRPVENDVLQENGQKILGGAIRRFDTTVLYQGSLQLPGARTNPVLKRAVIDGVRAFLAADLRPTPCCAGRLAAVRQQAVLQYQSPSWVEKF